MPRRGSELVVISWRDIPAQVNARAGAEKHQVVLPRRFQRAIDERGDGRGQEDRQRVRRRVAAHGARDPGRRATTRRRAAADAARRAAARRTTFPTRAARRRSSPTGWRPTPRSRVATMTVTRTASCSRRAGGAATSPIGTTVLDAARRARRRPRLGVQRAGALRALHGHARVRRVRQARRSRATPGTSTGRARRALTYRGRAPARRRGAGSACSARVAGDVVIDVPPASQVHRPVVRKTVALDDLVVDPVVRLYLVDVPAAELGARSQRAASGCSTRSPSSGASPASTLRPARARRAAARARRRRRARSTVAVHDGQWVVGGVARLRRHRVRRRGRRRVDDRRRPPLRPRDRRGARVGRDHEPADPLRRGPDEPRVVRDDARPGRRAELTSGRSAPALARARRRSSSRRRASPRRTSSTSCSSATRSCTTSCSASIRRRSAPRRSRSRPTSRSTRGPATSSSTCPTRTCTCCRASPVTSAPTPRPRCSQEGPHRGDAYACCSSTSARTPRSCSATASGCSRRRARPVRRSKGAQLSVRAAGDRGRDRAGAHRPRDARAAGQGDRRRRVVATSPASRDAVATTGVTGVCGSGVIEVIAELFLAGVIDADGTIDGAAADAARASCPTTARSRTCCYARRRRASCASPRTTCARSSSPRPRSTPGVDLLMDHAGITGRRRRAPRRRVRQPHRPAATRSCSA